MSVAVVSCIYGDRFDRFVSGWVKAIGSLSPRPDEIIVASDRERFVPMARVVVSDCPWRHPQGWHLRDAIGYASTDWVWICDIDDRAFPDALEGLGDVLADVWAMGYLRSDGEIYIPPRLLSGADVLDADTSFIPAGSAFRISAFWRSGGFPDVAFQDWALWRRMARSGASFQSSGRAHYKYKRHDGTRSEVELTPERRAEHLSEMICSELEEVAVAS